MFVFKTLHSFYHKSCVVTQEFSANGRPCMEVLGKTESITLVTMPVLALSAYLVLDSAKHTLGFRKLSPPIYK